MSRPSTPTRGTHPRPHSSPLNYDSPVSKGTTPGPLHPSHPLTLFALFNTLPPDSLGAASSTFASAAIQDSASHDCPTFTIAHVPDSVDLSPTHRSILWIHPDTADSLGLAPGTLAVIARANAAAATATAAGALVHVWPCPARPPTSASGKRLVDLRAAEVAMDLGTRKTGKLSVGAAATLVPWSGGIIPPAAAMSVHVKGPASLLDRLSLDSWVTAVHAAAVDRYVRVKASFEVVIGGHVVSASVTELDAGALDSHGLSASDAVSTVWARVGMETRVVVSGPKGRKKPPKRAKPVPHASLAAAVPVGGLDAETAVILRMRDALVGSLTASAASAADGGSRLVLPPARGVLLYGPPGTGKTALVRYIASCTRSPLFVLNGAEVLSKYYGETEAKLTAVFDAAVAAGSSSLPALLFVDEVDALAPSRSSHALSQLEKRVTSTLVGLLDGLVSGAAPVLFIGATNRVATLDASLRRPGRLDRELEIGVPSPAARAAILSAHLSALDPGASSLTPADIEELASRTHGFVGADLTALIREAAVAAVLDAPDTPLSLELFASVLGKVKPSALREHVLDVPSVSWSDIGGQAEAKQALTEAVEWPLKHPEAFARLGIRPPRGILLYGPPGCSKTMMAKALASESDLNFVAVKGPELFSMWVGESERAVSSLFAKARAAAPCIIFFDEIDALAGSRASGDGLSSVQERVLAQLLHEMDGVKALTSVVVVAATNRPDKLDDALLRPGRMDRILYVGLPDADARAVILANGLAALDPELVHPDAQAHVVDVLVPATDGYSGAEVAQIVKDAALAALSDALASAVSDAPASAPRVPVGPAHLDAALAALGPPRTSQDLLQFYADYTAAHAR